MANQLDELAQALHPSSFSKYSSIQPCFLWQKRVIIIPFSIGSDIDQSREAATLSIYSVKIIK